MAYKDFRDFLSALRAKALLVLLKMHRRMKIKNMRAVTEMGGNITPSVPAFYN